jgi:hypothetical protein
MAFLEAVLALVGLVALSGAIAHWQMRRQPESSQDLAAPYRDGLHAAVRLQSVAQDLEQQIYAEAIRRSSEAQGDEP